MISEKPWRWESALRLLLNLIVCFAMGSLLAIIARRFLGDKLVEAWMLNMIIATLSFQGAGLVLIAMFLRNHGTGWAQAFGFKSAPGRAMIIGALVAVIALPLVWYLQGLAIDMMNYFHYAPQEQEAVRMLRETPTAARQIYLGVMAILLAPVVEEMLFRGILYPLVKQTGFPRLALWGVAILFALVHQNLMAFMPLVFLALVLTLLYEWTDNLLACIVVHSLFNAVNFARLFFLNQPS